MKDKKLSTGLIISALGVVYGDIGTSPLYALKESFHHTHGLAVVEQNIFGVLSLIFWSLILIISLKYHLLILKADNMARVEFWPSLHWSQRFLKTRRKN
jgi:KUP system potassium uptake protein